MFLFKKQQSLYISLFLIVLLISVFFNNSAIAKPSRFQVGLPSDCRIYESTYKGIKCKNASSSDTPICNDDEDLVTSPRRSKICCCTRLLEEESVEGNGNNNANCRDVSCKNLNKEGKCENGLEIQEFGSDNGPVSCCCSPEKTHISDCKVIGCKNFYDKCPSDQPLTSFFINSTLPITMENAHFGGGRGFGCCCRDGGSNREAINSIICKQTPLGCQEPISGTESTCPSDLRAVNYDIYVKDSRDPIRPPANSSSGYIVGPQAFADIGTVERTIPCCCK